MHAQYRKQRLRLCMSNSNSGDINVYANDGVGGAAAQRSTFGGCVGLAGATRARLARRCLHLR